MAELVDCLLVDPERLRTMGAAARSLQLGDAALAILRDMGLVPVADVAAPVLRRSPGDPS